MAQRVVIVGAGLGGLRSAEALRADGFPGEVVVIGAEVHMPYNRPPLSKEALLNGVRHSTLELRRRASVRDVEWRLGTSVLAADLDAHTVTLPGEDTVCYDGLIVASGLRPRRLPFPGDGRHVLRTLEDAAGLRTQLIPGTRLLVIGAGFIGCEVAATARALGCQVNVVAADKYPMLRPFGALLGAELRRRHEQRGVRFALGVEVETLETTGFVTTAVLSNGVVLQADVVVEALGSQSNTEWLTGNELDLAEGVRTDTALRALQADGTPVDGVHVVGDLACFPNALFDDTPRRVEHWSIPTETGRRAAGALTAYLGGNGYDNVLATPFTPMPVFWSDQGTCHLNSFGMPALADTIEVLEGNVCDQAIIGYHRGHKLVAIVSVDMLPGALSYQSHIGQEYASTCRSGKPQSNGAD